MISHRGPEFASLLLECTEGMRWALRTTNDVLFFPASGTGALESAVANLLSPGEKVLFCTMGWFGEMWARIASAFGADVVTVDAPWGSPVSAEAIDEVISASPDIRKVFVTHNETSTGVTNDVAEIAGVVKGRGRLLVVDSISGAGCLPLNVDALGLDVVVTTSQKGWLAPPGLSMVSVSHDALLASTNARCPRWYFDFQIQKSHQDLGRTHTTPPISLMYALQEGLRMLREEGIERVWARHHVVADTMRRGLEALGLGLLAWPASASDTVTAVHSPVDSGEELERFLTRLRHDHGVVVAEGHGELWGRIFRVGHLADVTERDAHEFLGALEACLVNSGPLPALTDRSGADRAVQLAS